jgi:hypothetical protein
LNRFPAARIERDQYFYALAPDPAKWNGAKSRAQFIQKTLAFYGEETGEIH